MAIASYKEKRLFYCLSFDLYDDRLHIHIDERGKVISEDKINLKGVNPDYNILRVKDHRRDVIFVVVSFTCLILLFFFMSNAFKDDPRKLYWILAGLAVVFSINTAGLIFPRRMTFFTFNKNDGNVSFTVGCYGKYADKFDDFVRTLISQIKSNNY
jgi:hypothetical protein